MARLTDEQRAARRVKAERRRLERNAPLLLHAGAVQPASEAAALATVRRQRAEAEARNAAHEADAAVTRERASWVRAFVAVRVDPETLARLDEWLHRVYGPRKWESDPVYHLDFWCRVLRDGAHQIETGADPELATAIGYPPVPRSLPVSRAAARALMKQDPDYRAEVAAVCEAIEAKQRQRHGEQLGLALEGQG